MKVLQVNCVYRKGSTGKIVYDLHRGLIERGIDSVVCYGRGEKWSEPGVYKTCGEWYSKANHLRAKLTGMMYGGCYYSTYRLCRVIKKEQPDVVHLHCINGYFVNIYKLISWLKAKRIRTILTLHAEFMYTANCGITVECDGWQTGCRQCTHWKSATKSFFFNRTHQSWKKLEKAYRDFTELMVTSVSDWLMERAKQSPMLADYSHIVVMNGVDTSVFRPNDTAALRAKHDLSGKKIVFHITANFRSDREHLKGGYYVLELARMMAEENVIFLVAAAEAEEHLQWPDNVIFLGKISDQALLARYYSLADVTLLTSCRETFSMPVAESLCCGTPVVGFAAGGPETVALPEYSTFVPYGSTDSLCCALRQRLNLPKPEEIAMVAKKTYDMTEMTERYLCLYHERM